MASKIGFSSSGNALIALNPKVVRVPVLSKQQVSILPADSTLSALFPITPLASSLTKLAVLQI